MYTTPLEIRTVIGSPASDDPILQELIDAAEANFNTLVGSDEGLMSSEKTVFIPYDLADVTTSSGRVFILPTYNPTALTSINGEVVAGADYAIIHRKLSFREYKAPQTFPMGWTIVYTSGITGGVVPDDIKGIIREVVASAYNRRRSEGISEFSQDLLSVTYWSASWSQETNPLADRDSMISAQSTVIKKYKIPFVAVK